MKSTGMIIHKICLILENKHFHFCYVRNFKIFITNEFFKADILA